jgi:hypothetical protein
LKYCDPKNKDGNKFQLVLTDIENIQRLHIDPDKNFDIKVTELGADKTTVEATLGFTMFANVPRTTQLIAAFEMYLSLTGQTPGKSWIPSFKLFIDNFAFNIKVTITLKGCRGSFSEATRRRVSDVQLHLNAGNDGKFAAGITDFFYNYRDRECAFSGTGGITQNNGYDEALGIFVGFPPVSNTAKRGGCAVDYSSMTALFNPYVATNECKSPDTKTVSKKDWPFDKWSCGDTLAKLTSGFGGSGWYSYADELDPGENYYSATVFNTLKSLAIDLGGGLKLLSPIEILKKLVQYVNNGGLGSALADAVILASPDIAMFTVLIPPIPWPIADELDAVGFPFCVPFDAKRDGDVWKETSLPGESLSCPSDNKIIYYRDKYSYPSWKQASDGVCPANAYSDTTFPPAAYFKSKGELGEYAWSKLLAPLLAEDHYEPTSGCICGHPQVSAQRKCARYPITYTPVSDGTCDFGSFEGFADGLVNIVNTLMTTNLASSVGFGTPGVSTVWGTVGDLNFENILDPITFDLPSEMGEEVITADVEIRNLKNANTLRFGGTSDQSNFFKFKPSLGDRNCSFKKIKNETGKNTQYVFSLKQIVLTNKPTPFNKAICGLGIGKCPPVTADIALNIKVSGGEPTYYDACDTSNQFQSFPPEEQGKDIAVKYTPLLTNDKKIKLCGAATDQKGNPVSNVVKWDTDRFDTTSLGSYEDCGNPKEWKCYRNAGCVYNPAVDKTCDDESMRIILQIGLPDIEIRGDLELIVDDCGGNFTLASIQVSNLVLDSFDMLDIKSQYYGGSPQTKALADGLILPEYKTFIVNSIKPILNYEVLPYYETTINDLLNTKGLGPTGLNLLTFDSGMGGFVYKLLQWITKNSIDDIQSTCTPTSYKTATPELHKTCSEAKDEDSCLTTPSCSWNINENYVCGRDTCSDADFCRQLNNICKK